MSARMSIKPDGSMVFGRRYLDEDTDMCPFGDLEFVRFEEDEDEREECYQLYIRGLNVGLVTKVVGIAEWSTTYSPDHPGGAGTDFVRGSAEALAKAIADEWYLDITNSEED